jgi:hypothetical protein
MLTMSITPPPRLEDSPLFTPVRRRGRKKGQVNITPSRLYRDRAARAQRCRAFNAANPDQVRKWVSAMAAGARARPRCVAIKKTGERCGHKQMRTIPYCCKHAPDHLLAEHDIRERERLQIFILDRRASASLIHRALKSIVAIEVRMLKRIWRSGLWSHPGQTLILGPHDELAVERCLLTYGVDLELDGITPRTTELLRWCVYNFLRRRYSAARVKRSIDYLIKEDAAWRAANG